MPDESFLHQRSDFKALVEILPDSEEINDPTLVEGITGSCIAVEKIKKTRSKEGSPKQAKGSLLSK